MMTCPHCTEARRQRLDTTTPLCCICNGTFIIQQTWSLVWAWDYRRCDCQACALLRKMRPFTVFPPERPVMEPIPDDPDPMTCKACGKEFVPWPEGLSNRLSMCGPCYRERDNRKRTNYRRSRGIPSLRKTA